MPRPSFAKGNPGRKAGTQNKATVEARVMAQKLLDPTYWEGLRERLRRGKLAPAIEVKLLAYAYGEPKQTVDVDGDLTLRLPKIVHKLIPGPGSDVRYPVE